MNSNQNTERPPGTVSVRTPGKVNLTLNVLGRRPDGFHDLRSLVIGVGLYDTVSAGLAGSPGCRLSCSLPELETMQNLAWRAAEAVRERIPGMPGIELSITKRIPLGGGLGGGSSDAAAVLELCNELLGWPIAPEQLADIGAALGSDVPVFLSLPAAVMTGRGEIVTPVELSWQGSVLLVVPGFAISTREVYQAWRKEDAERDAASSDAALLTAKSADELGAGLTNDLEPAVFRVSPALGELLGALRTMGYGNFRVSGSGSTLFGLFDDPHGADHAAKKIESNFPGVNTMVVSAPVRAVPATCEDN